MATAVITVTRPASSSDSTFGNKKIRIRDITSDTGDYVVGGFTLTAAQFGLRRFDFITIDGAATEGTAGANAQVIGFRYNATSTAVTVQVYESAATGLPPLEKTAEAYPANFRFRAMAIGF